MNNKPFEQWWAELENATELRAKRIRISNRVIHVDESEARELHSQIVEAAVYAMPCTIMRRFAQMDDSPLGCYVPVAYCDHYGAFEELIEAAGKPHALICIQRQEERRKPKPEPKPAEPYVEFVVQMRFPGEAWIELGRFDTQEDAMLFTHEDGAFAPPGQREYRVMCEQTTPITGSFSSVEKSELVANTPKPDDQGANVARAMVLAQDVEELTKERDQLRTDLERLKKIAADYLTNGVSSGNLNEVRDAIVD